MKNPKKTGTDYERKIIDIINDILGSGYTRTKLSGGADDPGDMKDFWKTTPLAKYIQEIKYHGSEKEFRRKILIDIAQAINQTPSNRNWQLVIHLPNSQTEIVMMDLQDYLVNDICSQQLASKKDLRKTFNNMRTLLRAIKRYIDKLEAGA